MIRAQVSNTLALRKNAKSFLETIYRQEDTPLTFFPMLGTPSVMLRDPALVTIALQQEGIQTDQAIYKKPSVGFAITESIFHGPSVITLEGSAWADRRRLLNPPFSPHAVAQRFEGIFLEQTQQLVERLKSSDDLSVPRDIVPMLQQLTMENGVAGLFQRTLQPENVEAVKIGVESSDQHFVDEFANIIPLPSWIKTPKRRRFDEQTAPMRQTVRRIIAEERQSAREVDMEHASLPALLAQANLTDQAIESELTALLMAGYQTTALALSWAFYLLATHPQIQDRLALALQSGETDLMHVPFLKHVVEETLRLFPSAWFTFRATTQPTTLGEYALAKGTWLFISPYFLHRDGKLWENPEAFLPDRFESPPIKGSYIPFIRGPHVCLGQHFATLEMLVVIGTLVRQLSFQPVPGHEPIPQFKSVISPSNGIKLKIQRR
jgi:cytochrome P450